MRVEVTQKGLYVDGKEVPIGTELTVSGDVLPGAYVNKVRVIGRGKTAITNPAKGGQRDNFPASAAERQARMKEIVSGLDKDKDFIANGAPDVNALNALLGEDEKPFTADERDQLWPGIKDG